MTHQEYHSAITSNVHKASVENLINQLAALAAERDAVKAEVGEISKRLVALEAQSAIDTASATAAIKEVEELKKLMPSLNAPAPSL